MRLNHDPTKAVDAMHINFATGYGLPSPFRGPLPSSIQLLPTLHTASVGHSSAEVDLKLGKHLGYGAIWDTFSIITDAPTPSDHSSPSPTPANQPTPTSTPLIVKLTDLSTFYHPGRHDQDTQTTSFPAAQARTHIAAEFRTHHFLARKGLAGVVTPACYGLLGSLQVCSDGIAGGPARQVWAMVMVDAGREMDEAEKGVERVR